MGHRERDVRRRPEERGGAGKEDEQGSRTERRPDRRAHVGIAAEVRAVRLGAEGRRDAEAQGGDPETQHPRERVPEALVERLGEEAVVGQQGTDPGRHQEALDQPAPIRAAPDAPGEGALWGMLLTHWPV